VGLKNFFFFFFFKFALLDIGKGEGKRDKESFLFPGRREMDKYVLGQCHFGQSLS
jgi:hypothetical protein